MELRPWLPTTYLRRALGHDTAGGAWLTAKADTTVPSPVSALCRVRKTGLAGAATDPEDVNLVGSRFQGFVESVSLSLGLLIHAASGSGSGVGGLRTKRSGWAA